MIPTDQSKPAVLEINGQDDQMNHKNNNATKPSKLGNLKLDVKSFYNKHFPTDRKTYEWRLPFVGLIVSIVSCYCLFVVIVSPREADQFNIIQYCYIFVAAVLAYQLYYGLHIGDRKQFTPWIILKLIEIIISLIFGILLVASEGLWVLWFFFVILIYSGINSILTYIVITTSIKQLHGDQRKINPDENVYDILQH